MNISNKIKNEIKHMEKLSLKIREKSLFILNYLEKKGVDTTEYWFENAWGYIVGDCSCNEILKYLERLD